MEKVSGLKKHIFLPLVLLVSSIATGFSRDMEEPCFSRQAPVGVLVFAWCERVQRSYSVVHPQLPSVLPARRGKG